MNLSDKDKAYIWHPFTEMSDWCADHHDPLVIDKGEGVYVFDKSGRKYIDGNSSIWTNLHGHNDRRINQAIIEQLNKIAHASFLGTTNQPAILLAEMLVNMFPNKILQRVFYSDDGSTAIECAMKVAIQYFQIIGQPQKKRFVAFDNAYHGDTFGASSIGGIDKFFSRFNDFIFPTVRLNCIDELKAVDAKEIEY